MLLAVVLLLHVLCAIQVVLSPAGAVILGHASCGLLVLSMLYSLPVFPVCSHFLLTLLLLFDSWASLAHCGVWRMAASCWRICELIAGLFCLFVVVFT